MVFQNKVALVTGAGNGIGNAISLALAKEGATIVVADINLPSAERTVSEIVQSGGNAVAYGVDVTSGEQVVRLFQFIVDQFGRLDLLINNVGNTIRKPIVFFTEEEWDYVFDSNVKSMFLCAREAGKIMLKQKSGAVVNISSIHALGGISKRLPYSSSKTAVESFTKTLACEWALDGVRVNAVSPGYILTNAIREAFASGALQEDDMIRRTPQARLGQPHNIADAVVFLCSEKSSYITGAILQVDGGYAAYHGPETVPSFNHEF